MIIRCSVCRLPADKRQAIDAALTSGQASLAEIGRVSKISVSALQRHHANHLNRPVGAAEALHTAIAPVQQLGAAGLPMPPQTPASNPESTKDELLSKIRFLWGEALEGLDASKQSLTVTKPDGSTLEIPGDLRARTGFIREARKIAELEGTINGDLEPAPNNINGVIIVLPQASAGKQFASEPYDTECVVDIGLIQR